MRPSSCFACQHQIGRPAEDLAAVVGRHVLHDGRPGDERREGLIDVGRRRFGDGIDDRAVKRVGDGNFLGAVLPFSTKNMRIGRFLEV